MIFVCLFICVCVCVCVCVCLIKYLSIYLSISDIQLASEDSGCGLFVYIYIYIYIYTIVWIWISYRESVMFFSLLKKFWISQYYIQKVFSCFKLTKFWLFERGCKSQRFTLTVYISLYILSPIKKNSWSYSLTVIYSELVIKSLSNFASIVDWFEKRFVFIVWLLQILLFWVLQQRRWFSQLNRTLYWDC